MPRSYLGRRFDQVLGAIGGGKRPRPRRARAGRFAGVETLESRALLANVIASGADGTSGASGATSAAIVASGALSSTPDGGDYSYTIALTNSSQSTSPIGTFWFAWAPGQDYLATMPISVNAPAGWTYQINSGGSGGGSNDGYSIEFTASDASDDIQPGSSLNFSFISADTPASVEGNSIYYSGIPVGTSSVYEGAAINDGGTPFVVSAPVTLASIAVTPASSSVPSGESDQLTAIGTFTNNSTQNLTSVVSWSSNAAGVAGVSNTSGSQGLVTGLGPGTASISASIDGVTGQTPLTVSTAALTSLAITPANPFVEVGNYEQLAVTGTFSDNSTQVLTTAVNWTSGTPSVASISNTSGSQGLLEGTAKGSSTISASIDGVTGSTTLTVTPTLESIAITPADSTVPKGETEQFTATGTYADDSTEDLTNEVTWSSGNTTTSTISNAAGSIGFAPALATGTSTISASFEGVTGSTLMTVSPPVLVSIWLAPASPSILQGTTDQFTASGIYSDGSTQNLTSLASWTSATPSVATISPAGLAAGTTSGASSISASYQGITGSYALAVDPPPVTLTNVETIVTRRKVSQIVLTFSSSLDADLAVDRSLYRLVSAGNGGLFAGKNATVIKVSNAQYFAASAPDTVTLIPRVPFTLRKPVELTINGLPPSGLQDSEGRFIDGNGDGQPGSKAVAVLSKNGTTIETDAA
jgi:hypothetical protein